MMKLRKTLNHPKLLFNNDTEWYVDLKQYYPEDFEEQELL